MVDKLTARTVQQQARAERSDEDLRKWCVEQAVVLVASLAHSALIPPVEFVAIARKIEDYVRGRITTP